MRIGGYKYHHIFEIVIASGIINSVDLIISNDIHFKKALTEDFVLTFDE